MSTHALLKLAADPRLIPGVYSYCDHWCEQCRLTSRCLVFASTRAEGEMRDAGEWFAQISLDMNDAMELLQQEAAELGVELSAPPSPEDHSEAQAVRTLVTEHPLVDHARHYARLADVWLAGHAAAASAHAAARPIDTIRWYELQIGAKLHRALGSLASGPDDPEPGLQTDGNGSAKVALIGIDASIGAWFDLLALSPSRNGVAAIIERLHRLREDVEQAFPHARVFVRPGFDTGDAPWPEDLAAWPPA
jgi:hypothetical protein